MSEDPREAAERYRLGRALRDAGMEPAAPPEQSPARGSTAAERAAFVETAIQQAIRRGDFDDLPGAGKPLAGLGDSHDPDWWIRRKIQTEQLTGLGPPALTLRVEYAERAQRMDAIARETEVREALEDFNRRVIEARRQLLGGPPVVTPTVDVDAEVAAWTERRREREAASAADEPAPRRRWGRRGR
ncbi:DnaJ family domain-containing protein [Microbacterium sp. NPDC090007]|uniref:DnaJ family domain-containing protein n=1 Tax=Microbacterium sp. NPDC090007 TaxID=3364204 RepID=UPI00380F6D0E